MSNPKKTFAEKTITLFDMMPDEVKKGLEKSIEQSKKGLGRSQEEVMLSLSQKKEIDRRWENPKTGKSKSYTIDEVNEFIKVSLKK